MSLTVTGLAALETLSLLGAPPPGLIIGTVAIAGLVVALGRPHTRTPEPITP